jgi:hypothetical protein
MPGQLHQAEGGIVSGIGSADVVEHAVYVILQVTCGYIAPFCTIFVSVMDEMG